jgi:hypothetical protein
MPSFAGSTESAVAADVRELLKQWKDEHIEGDALLDALRELFTVATLKKRPPIVVHDIRLFMTMESMWTCALAIPPTTLYLGCWPCRQQSWLPTPAVTVRGP